MINKVQKKLQKQKEKKDQDSKQLMIVLDEFIEDAKMTQIGEFTKVNNNLFEVKVKFNSKFVSKQEYCQLLGLQKYLKINPNYVEENLRKVIYSRPIKYGFIIECDRKVENLFDELKNRGAYNIAESISKSKESVKG